MMTYIWLGLLAVFIVIEAATAQLVTIWFAIGALCAFICTFFTENIFIQSAVFIAVSAAALVLTRPVVRKLTAAKKLPTNADMVIGAEGIVIEDINNLDSKGLVKVKGSMWTARSTDDKSIIESGEKVTVERIEGVKLIVKKQ